MDRPARQNEFQQLLVGLTDGELSDAQLARLEEILLADPKAREDYHRQLQMHTLLQFGHRPASMPSQQLNSAEAFADYVRQASNQAEWQVELQHEAAFFLSDRVVTETPGTHADDRSVSLPARVDYSRPGVSSMMPGFPMHASGLSWRSLALIGLVAAVCAVTGAEMWVRYRHDSQQQIAEIQPPPATPVAFLKVADGCNWGGAADLWSANHRVQLGDEITLNEGIAEFQLTCGVSLNIEGPTSFVLTSPTSLVLQHGKITTFVPPQVAKFQLMAGACRVSARDADFGVCLTGGDIDVHVFKGEVLAASAIEDSRDDDAAPATGPARPAREDELDPGSEFSSVTISARRGLALRSHDDITEVMNWHAATIAEFAAKMPQGGQLPISRKYVEAVLASRPISYWRFESQLADGIPNEIPQAESLDVVGKVRLAGEASNHVAELGLSDSYGYLSTVDPVDAISHTEYSVEVWIKPNHIHTGCAVALLAQDADTKTENQAFFLQVIGDRNSKFGHAKQKPKEIRYLHRDPPSRDAGAGVQCYSGKPYSVRRWQHIVAVKKSDSATLYVDGKRLTREADKTLLSTGLRVLVGERASGDEYRRFVGQLDELAIYDHALSREEVEKHYRAVDWNGEDRAAGFY